MNKHHKLIKPLTGHFLGWGDNMTPHRYIKLATNRGERLVKIAKSLRPQVQDWQPGMLLTLLSQERICPSTGETKIKIKQLLTPPLIDPSSRFSLIDDTLAEIIPVEPTKIRVCQGSSCRRRGSEQICQSIKVYLDQNDLTEQVQIETVKCLHQCKAAPHAIFSNSNGDNLPAKTHYRQLQPNQLKIILAKHFPTKSPSKPNSSNLIEKISNYLDQYRISTSNTLT